MDKYSLVGINGNAFSIMAYVAKAMRAEGFSQEEVEAYQAKAMSESYDELLVLSIEMVDKCNEKGEG